MFTNHVEYNETDDDEIPGCIYMIFGIPGAIMLIIMLCLIPGKVKYFMSAKRIMAEVVSYGPLWDSDYFTVLNALPYNDNVIKNINNNFLIVHNAVY